jgi:hypothetical protein
VVVCALGLFCILDGTCTLDINMGVFLLYKPVRARKSTTQCVIVFVCSDIPVLLCLVGGGGALVC